LCCPARSYSRAGYPAISVNANYLRKFPTQMAQTEVLDQLNTAARWRYPRWRDKIRVIGTNRPANTMTSAAKSTASDA
jgi:hypothetical protein